MAATITFNPEQKDAFKAIKKFLEHPSANVFVLQGYAGTGKTFLMQQVAKWLKESEREFCLLAATGRAATVLKGKTGFSAKTVHGELYNFSGMAGMEESGSKDAPMSSTGQLSLQFSIRQTDEEPRLYIVDESSMLSGVASKGDGLMDFGSGILLNDLFEVAGKNKIIFVGDPCQLPPIGQTFSPALDTKWLNEQDKIAVSVKLNKIERTDSGNDILKLAGAIRAMYDEGVFELYPKLPASNLNNVKIHTSDRELLNAYFEKYKTTGATETLAIARTNLKVYEINRFMRRKLMGDANLPIQIGEVLLVTQNNYKVPLTNGDFVKVCYLGEVTKRAGLSFQKVKVRTFLSDTEFEMLLSLDAIKSLKGTLSEDQTRDLMIDFSHRMREQDIAYNSAEFKAAMMADEYYNCLKATFGYAVTCHKAQGGEWNNVYLFLDNDKNGMFSMPASSLCKWWYTAVTRARQELNLVKHWWVV
ncbi:ATP-dependent DNA helicase [Mucilaginibacter pedocola]|uniref:UvrD-like helicase C-terminal domain-containing protein n=1 Tax=Mucilaginibacter pedocola TaxID=1792845 RepID=A0A1S9P994_9SPHI|nr:DEAD/DEAH box helicase [Mucilaginibacter pedocola]OOQ57525.1 hypothetical protein BC343_11985 [Mucilaginibacter pedocola]